MTHSWQTIWFSISLTGDDSEKKEALDYFDMYFRNIKIDEDDLSATFDGTEGDFIDIVPHDYLAGENYDICSHDIYEIALKVAEELEDYIDVSFIICGSINGFDNDCQDFTITYEDGKITEYATIWYREIICEDYIDYEDFCDSYGDLLTEEEFNEVNGGIIYANLNNDKVIDTPGEKLITEKIIAASDDVDQS